MPVGGLKRDEARVNVVALEAMPQAPVRLARRDREQPAVPLKRVEQFEDTVEQRLLEAQPSLHDEIARLAMAGPAQIVAGIGEFERALTSAVSDAAARDRLVVAPDVPELWSRLAPRLARDAVILLKGSRGMRLERLIPLLEALSHQTPATS